MFRKYLGPYFSPDDSGSGDVQPFGETGDVALLEEGADEADAEESDDKSKDRSPDSDVDKEDDGGEDEKDEEDEEKDDEGEDEGEEEEKLDEKSGKPALKTITAKYPNLFKDFPQLKNAYFRADAYSELFPSIEDAREAQAKSDTLDQLENVIIKQGSSKELFDSIKESSPQALGKFVENLLPTLYNFDSKLFYKATEPITRQLLWSAKQHGLKTKDDNLVASTQHLANFLFGESDVEQPKTARRVEDDPERAEFEKEKSAFENRKRGEFLTDLNMRAGKDLVKIISDGLDPKNVMSDFLKQTITEKILDEVGSRLEKDTRHMSRMTALHNRAAKAGFPKAMTDQIASAYLSAAKLLIPAVRTEIKQKAMSGKSSNNGNNSRRQIPSSGTSRGSNLPKNLSSKQVDWSKTTDMDFLMDKVTLKK